MDRDRQRPELYGAFSDCHRNSHSSTSSWSSDDPPPPPPPINDPNFDANRGGSSGDGHHHHRPHNNHQSHRHHSNQRHNHQQNFNSEQNGSVSACGLDDNSGHFGQKRPFSHSLHGLSSDCIEGGSFVKLYVGGIPRTTTQEEVHSLFEEHGKIVEVVRLKDKRTYQPHECGFVKYTTLEEADRAIGALHNKYTFPGGVAPIKVRYADGERERLGGFGTQDCKLYVGCLNKQASKREIEEIFSAYGFVESVYIVLDEVKQSRGCGFIQYSRRDTAVAAMNALGGTYIMRGCDQPLIIRFADPKKPRMGEPRPAPYLNDSRVGHTLPDASLSPSPKTMVSSSQSPGPGGKPQTVSRSSSLSELVSTAEPLDCDWSEHTCPDGYKYYYNCATCESRWEKPEDYLLFERRVPKQQPWQMQLSSHQQVLDHMQVQAATSVTISPTCF